jgi:hypothetical protein
MLADKDEYSCEREAERSKGDGHARPSYQARGACEYVDCPYRKAFGHPALYASLDPRDVLYRAGFASSDSPKWNTVKWIKVMIVACWISMFTLIAVLHAKV